MDDFTKPSIQKSESRPYQASRKSGGGLIAAGYVCGLLAIAILPIPLGITGFVLGIVNLTKGSTGHGIAQMIISLTCGLVGALFGAVIGRQVFGG
jgi:hypothetical protein